MSLSSQYPNDDKIETDPSVLFVEKFNEPLITDVVPKWGDGILNTASFSSDIPGNFPTGSRSLKCPRLVGDKGVGLYRKLLPGFDELYVRYYIKHDSAGPPSHSGIWMGGYNPPSDWPQGFANTKPTGLDFFSAAFEQSRITKAADHYNYWTGMHPDGVGNYWGNTLLNNPAVVIPLNVWTCIEHRVKLNSPLGNFNGEHTVWINGVKVSSLGLGFPHGTWSGGKFTQYPAATSVFEGFRWRSIDVLKVNWVWLQAYVDTSDPSLITTTWFANVVVATQYVGPLVPVVKKRYRGTFDFTVEEVE